MFDDLVGTPFKFQDTDCWWLAREVFKRYGIDLPDYNIARQACSSFRTAAHEIEKNLVTWTRIEQPETPCLVALSLGVPGMINHVGVYVGDGKFIHNSRLRGSVCIERLGNPLYANRKFYRYDSPDDH